MKIKNQLVHFLYCLLLIAGTLCACKNDAILSNVNDVSNPLKLLPYQPRNINLDYGELHNDILDAGIEACNYYIDPSDYIVNNVNSPNFYSLFTTYSNIISNVTRDYIYSLYDVSILIDTISSPEAFWNNTFYQREMLRVIFPAASTAITLTENLFEEYHELISDSTILFEENPYWMELSSNIETYANEIFEDCIPLCNSDDEVEYLDGVMSVMVGSFSYWSDENNMEAWREMAWNAQCQYLNLNELNYDDFEQYHTEFKKTDGYKIMDFVLADLTGAAIGATLGSMFVGVGAAHGAIAIGSIFSGREALSWN